ncbi:MAG: hypothetical protein ACLQBD_08395 [Syntrophobacteraceae bacterium]
MAYDAVETKGGCISVVERFPEKREALKQLFAASQSFQLLCDEYEACLTALRYWRDSSLPEAPDLRNEFSSLLSELEEEILEQLDNELPYWPSRELGIGSKMRDT